MHALRRVVKQFALRFDIISELFQFLWRNKLWWVIPIIFVIGVALFIVLLGQHTGVSALIYPLF